MTFFRKSNSVKLWTAALAAALVIQPLAASAAPITPTLAQNPIAGLNPVKPNIMFTIDDSGSMAWDYVPDYVGQSPGSSVFHCRDSTNCTLLPADPPYRANGYNGMFYDPDTSYTPGVKHDGAPLPCQGTDVTCGSPWTAVYVNGYANYPGSNNGGTTNLVTGYPDTIWCSKDDPSSSEKLTADGNGSICRRNGFAYNQVTVSGNTMPAIAAGYNYPNSSVSCVSGQRCKFTYPFTVNGSPYYYTVSKVQFCSAKDSAGWGTTPCQSTWSSTFKFVRYGTSATLTFDPQAFTRVDIRSSGFLVNGVAAANPTGRTYAEAMANFANWYAFYRTRILSMKTAAGIAFTTLDQNSRVGLNTLWENATLYTNIQNFDATHKNTWITRLYKVNPGGGTPLPDAMWRVGELFSGNLAASGLPGATDPLDPVTGKCQPNFHLFSTDGYWNSTLSLTSRGNRDRTVPAQANLPGNTGFTVGANFPRPYYEGATATSNNLADLAMYYWINDLRPTVANNVNDTVAPWQHVKVYGMSIGARGTVDFPMGLNAITAGTANWLPATGAGGPESVDDLWRASINSRGRFFNPSNARELAESIVSALADFTDQAGTGAAVGLAGAQLGISNQYAYKTSYETGMWGDVRKYAIDVATGVLPVDADGNPANAPLWSAADKLEELAAVAGGVDGWDANRRILTMDDAKTMAIPFRHNRLSAAQRASLSAGWTSVPNPPTSQQVLDYLRGDRSNEGVGTTNFRPRSRLLGDIVNSNAVVVGPPSAPYMDTGTLFSPNPGYNAYKASKASRATAVYVGANDGMLHAFDDTVANGGTETWAYIPRTLFDPGDPNDTAHAPSNAFQLGALSYRRGGIPLFSHKFYVNATARAADVDFRNTLTSSIRTTFLDWRTILVSGLGAGGRGVFALDVTDPVSTAQPPAGENENQIGKRVLWEFTDADLGYVFDAPTVVKTYAYGWVVLVASGYNNPGGKGYLYVLNPSSASKKGIPLLQKIPLPGDTGTDASPTGLSSIRAYVGSRQNPYVLQAYGGDLKGNVWRFDLSSIDPTKWKAERIAKFTDAGGKPQPITSGVRVEIDQNNNVDRYLVVGTGRLLDQPDLSDTSVTNTMYVIRDGDRNTPDPAPATPWSRTDLNAVSGASITGFTGAATGRGWYQDATNTKQKINSDTYADVNVVVYGFSEPSADACETALTSTLHARDLNTANSVLQSGGSIVAGVNIGSGIAGVSLIQAQAASPSASAPVLVQVTTMKGQIYSVPVSLGVSVSTKHRFSWGLVSP